MIVDSTGQPTLARPQPNTFTEQRVNAELSRYDPLLHIRWMPAGYVAEDGSYEGRYALACRWPQADKRWSWVREGKYDPNDAVDVMGWFCSDMHDASSVPHEPEQMLSRVLALLGECDNERFPWRGRMASAIKANEDRRELVKQEAVEEAVDAASTGYYHSERASRVFQSGGKNG